MNVYMSMRLGCGRFLREKNLFAFPRGGFLFHGRENGEVGYEEVG